MEKICEAIGLPFTRLRRDSEELRLLTQLGIEFFLDGEVVFPIARPTTALLRKIFGKKFFKEGEALEKLNLASQSQDPELKAELREFAIYLARVVAEQISDIAPAPTIKILGENIKVDGINLTWQSRINPQNTGLVIDFGPGLQGKHRVDEQYKAIQQGHVPYRHVAICRGPFVNQLLLQYWRTKVEDLGLIQRWQIYLGREDGLAKATHAIIAGQRAASATPEIADVVLASGIHLAEQEELVEGIKNAHSLLTVNGHLLVRAPNNRSGYKGSTAAEIIEMARVAGFRVADAQIHQITTTSDIYGAVQSTLAFIPK